jgi:[ribosomal protein S5]-alanine N-acetyltransferase
VRVRRRGILSAAPSTPDAELLERYAAEHIYLRYLNRSDREEFLTLVHDSRALHRPWAYPPERPDQFEELVARARRDDFVCVLAWTKESNEIAGVFTISQIVRGFFQSAYLGYYAGSRHTGKGLMSEAMVLVLDLAFGPLSLHRLEANIQPGNAPSIALARRAGFRLEGYSPRYLLIGGRWRDHERYAITADEHAANRADDKTL